MQNDSSNYITWEFNVQTGQWAKLNSQYEPAVDDSQDTCKISAVLLIPLQPHIVTAFMQLLGTLANQVDDGCSTEPVHQQYTKSSSDMVKLSRNAFVYKHIRDWFEVKLVRATFICVQCG